jgi:UDP-N-acetylmuramoyl-tripeptide--D-alanyl-D-alanine ligase
VNALLAVVTLLACGIQAPRWFRVAQREHYLPSVGVFAVRWWRSSGANLAVGLAAVAATVAALRVPSAVFAVAAFVVFAPIGLSLGGRTSKLAWTARMRATAGVTGAAVVVGVVVALVIGMPLLYGVLLLAFPWLTDLGLLVWNPIQRRSDQRWVDQAKAGLDRSGARVVAITGSYGKTTTKGYLAHLLAGQTTVTASPASFNNRMGLARAVNEHLGTGTDVFIAEMGTYGPGEIRELCSWIPPEVAVWTALGPVHLERMKTLEGIAEAKREIFERSDVGVILIDDPRMARIAVDEAQHRRMITVSVTGARADVIGDLESGEITVDDRVIGRVDPDTIHVGNAACAVGATIGLGFDVEGIGERLASLPTPPHRQVAARSDRGFLVIDDTFNSNPAGASRALDLLAAAGEGRRVVVTPGMVEMGRLQRDANAEFARKAATVAGDVAIVGRTNRAALESGVRESGGASVHFFATRDEAVAWVREQLGPGDAVLYENDLPDHYP